MVILLTWQPLGLGTSVAILRLHGPSRVWYDLPPRVLRLDMQWSALIRLRIDEPARYPLVVFEPDIERQTRPCFLNKPKREFSQPCLRKAWIQQV